MQYLHRRLERKFLHMNSLFKALLVTGARQVGKTTMLRKLAANEKRRYATMDDAATRELAQNDPALFFQMYKPPVLIDEIQKAPQLFEQIKIICDNSDKTGLFWLTGSQRYEVMKDVRESLAGRIGILELYSMSLNEIYGTDFSEELDFSFATLAKRENQTSPPDVQTIFERIWQGGMPGVLGADDEQRREYYNSYIETYLLRDVSEAGGVRDIQNFRKFLSASSAFAGQLLNVKTLADTVGISHLTAAGWLKILEGLGIIFLLQPFAVNTLKRLTKTPKLYFCDTGLCAHLSRWLTSDSLLHGAAAGHYFENYVTAELKKYYSSSRTAANLFYCRDQNAKEIDLIVEQGNTFHPLEIKLSATPDRREIKKFTLLDSLQTQRSTGGIICMCQKTVPIDDKNCFIPCNLF